MPSKKGYEVGDIVLLKGDKKMTPYRIMAKFDYFRTCMIKNCENPLDVIEVDEDQLCYADEYNDVKYVHRDEIRHVWKNSNTPLNEFYASVPDEFLDDLAPYVDESSHSSAAQEEYNMVYNAVGSVEHILLSIIRCATSVNKMSNAELLALRDRAEEFGNAEIVHAIDTHFDEGDD